MLHTKRFFSLPEPFIIRIDWDFYFYFNWRHQDCVLFPLSLYFYDTWKSFCRFQNCPGGEICSDFRSFRHPKKTQCKPPNAEFSEGKSGKFLWFSVGYNPLMKSCFCRALHNKNKDSETRRCGFCLKWRPWCNVLLFGSEDAEELWKYAAN